MTSPIANPRILVLDSGVGGLSVCATLVGRLPDCELRFVADNSFHPYGPKPAEKIRERVFAIIEEQAASFDPHLIVLACNTATIAAIYEARAQLSNPSLIEIIGTEPAIKPATRRTLSGTIGLLATEATVTSDHVAKRIEEVGEGATFLLRAAPDLVMLAERKMGGSGLDLGELSAALSACFSAAELTAMDTCILGCTHFPLLKDELKRIGPAINWIDTGEDVSRRACTLLGRTGLYGGALAADFDQSQEHWMVFTDKNMKVAVSPQRLVRLGLGRLVVANSIAV